MPVLAPWQQKLTFGPGDVFDIGLYGKPDTQRGSVVIAPDGRFSYLQALDVTAAGLTVDELRAQLETLLMKYHLAPRVVLVPTFHSKKYYVQGEVLKPGAYPLVAPATVLDAPVNAGGFREFANQKRIVVLRGAERLRFNYKQIITGKNREQNIYLQPGDQIIVP